MYKARYHAPYLTHQICTDFHADVLLLSGELKSYRNVGIEWPCSHQLYTNLAWKSWFLPASANTAIALWFRTAWIWDIKINFPMSEGASERANKWAQRSAQTSSAEQANEWVVRVNERADERMAQYLRPDFKRFWISVHRLEGFDICRNIILYIYYEFMYNWYHLASDDVVNKQDEK